MPNRRRRPPPTLPPPVVDLRGIELAISQPEAIGHKSDVVDNSVVNIDSESESGSTSSGDTSRSRSRSRDRANKRLGAAAATALVTATIPFDVEECDRIVERELALPTAFAMQLQHEGGLVAVMADTGTVVGVTPKMGQQPKAETGWKSQANNTGIENFACYFDLRHSVKKDHQARLLPRPRVRRGDVRAAPGVCGITASTVAGAANKNNGDMFLIIWRIQD